jgi:hypothetical protein
MMGGTVLSNNARTIQTENNGKILQRYVMDNLVIGTL